MKKKHLPSMQNSLVSILPLHQRVRRQRVDQVVQLEGDVVADGEQGEDAGWRGGGGGGGGGGHFDRAGGAHWSGSVKGELLNGRDAVLCRVFRWRRRTTATVEIQSKRETSRPSWQGLVDTIIGLVLQVQGLQFRGGISSFLFFSFDG